MKKNSSYILLLLAMSIVLGLSMASCSGTAATSSEPVAIKVAVLPILDTLPKYVAENQGLFTKHGVEVEFIPAGSAPKRDELINSGRADAMINELVSTIFYNRDETRVKIVRYARIATSDSPLFFILASAQSGITEVGELKGVEIGISEGTVIEYLTDRILESEGFSVDEINGLPVPDIGQRMALLGSGELSAAMLPDPLASLVRQQGAVVVIDDSSHPEYSNSTYSFRQEFIDQNPDAVEGFLAAIEEAVVLINEDPAKWSDLLIERELVPPPLIGNFSVPTFVTASIPTQAQWDDAIEWVNENGLNAGEASYQGSITDKFLP